MEVIRNLDFKRVVVLRIELCDIYIVKKFATRVFDDDNLHAGALLRNKRKYTVGKIRVDHDQLVLCHAHKLLHLLKRIINLPVKKDFLRRKLLVLHRVKNQFKSFFIVNLIGIVLCLIRYLPPFSRLNAIKERRY